MNRLAIPIVALLLVACTPAQLLIADSYRAQLEGVCAMLLVVVPGTWAENWAGACKTGSEIAKLALDPSSLTWLKEIIGKLR